MKNSLILIAVSFILLLPFGLGQSAPRKDSELLKRGRALYQEYCTQCHGMNGNGKGRVGEALNLPPADFTRPFEEWKFSKGDLKRVFEAITNGIPGTAMPKVRLSEEECWALAYAVVEFATPAVDSPRGRTK